MDFVRSDNCHRIRNRAARSFVRGPSVHRSFEKLGAHHWRTRARFTDESSLVELVRVPAVRHAPVLIWMSVRTPKKRRARRSRPTHLRPSRRHVFPHCLAGALGIFFCFDLCARASGVARADQISAAVWIAVVLSMFPILRDWDERLWPNEAQLAKRMERRIESAQIRDLALSLRSPEVHPFLAPWWLSPSIAYWSGQPGVAGSSHESLNGSRRARDFFFRRICKKHARFLRNATWRGFSPTIPTAWRKIPQPS
jgi:hypothetical protein